MPNLARRCGGRPVISLPWNRICPERTGRRPTMLSMMVVRPAPLRPTSDTTSLSSTLSDTPRRMCAGPRKVLMLSTSSSTLRLLRSGRERNTEENIGDVLVRLDFFRRPVGEERTFMHHHDAIRIAKNHIHVVLDDDGSHRAGAHDLGDGVHDLRLVARAHAARRFVEKQKLRSQRIGDRYIEQLALALCQST